jgi:hypothetical protein
VVKEAKTHLTKNKVMRYVVLDVAVPRDILLLTIQEVQNAELRQWLLPKGDVRRPKN